MKLTIAVLVAVLIAAHMATVAAAADVCPSDIKQCPDGSYVSRDPSNSCEFAPCPDPALCANVSCSSPPSAHCSGDNLVTYSSSGSCSAGACGYPKSSVACQYGCSNAKCNDACANVQCNSPPAPACVSSSLLRAYDPGGTCSAGGCGYAFTDTNCEFGCANGKCGQPASQPQPRPQPGSTASEQSSPAASPASSGPSAEASPEISYHGRPPEPYVPEPGNASSSAGGGGGGSAITSVQPYEEEAAPGQNTGAFPIAQAGGRNISSEQKEKESGLPGVSIEKSENATVIISGGVRAETAETVLAAESRLFIRDETPASEIKILPDHAQEIAAKAGARFVTSLKIEMKETAIYSIHGYSEKKLLGIIPVKVRYEISLNAAEGSVQKVSGPWWGIFAV